MLYYENPLQIYWDVKLLTCFWGCCQSFTSRGHCWDYHTMDKYKVNGHLLSFIVLNISVISTYAYKNLTLDCYCHWIRMSGWFLYLSLHHSEEAGYSHRWTLTSRPNTDLRSSEWKLTWWALFCVTFSSIYDKNTHIHLQIFSILTAQLNCVCFQNNRSRRCQAGPRKT